MLSLDGCTVRLNRFKAVLETEGVDAAVLSNPRTIYYLSGHLREEESPQFLVVTPDRRTILVTDSAPSMCTADEVLTYESYSIDWPVSFAAVAARAGASLEQAIGKIKAPTVSVGIERERLNCVFFELLARRWPAAKIHNLTPGLCQARRRKDADEIELIKQCVEAIEAGYAAARRVIQPGITELELFNEVHGAIVKRARYQLKVNGDFACGVRAIRGGGTPVDRRIEAGDLCILDIYPSFHGYHADLCRTFVASKPTELQREAWEIARAALQQAERMIRPGVRASLVWKAIRDLVDRYDFVRESFWHHAGHGIGLDPQEPPWIIPGGDHVFDEGDVIALEPGCYATSLQGGVRLERNYIVGKNGLVNLSEFPLDLI